MTNGSQSQIRVFVPLLIIREILSMFSDCNINFKLNSPKMLYLIRGWSIFKKPDSNTTFCIIHSNDPCSFVYGLIGKLGSNEIIINLSQNILLRLNFNENKVTIIKESNSCEKDYSFNKESLTNVACKIVVTAEAAERSIEEKIALLYYVPCDDSILQELFQLYDSKELEVKYKDLASLYGNIIKDDRSKKEFEEIFEGWIEKKEKDREDP